MHRSFQHIPVNQQPFRRLKKLLPWSNIAFLDYRGAWGEEEKEGTSEAAWKAQTANRLFCSLRDVTVRQGLSTEFPVLMWNILISLEVQSCHKQLFLWQSKWAAVIEQSGNPALSSWDRAGCTQGLQTPSCTHTPGIFQKGGTDLLFGGFWCCLNA